MKKVAKLVYVSVGTRVVVDENATEEEIMQKARPQLIRNLKEDGILDHVESIDDDTEIPFGEGNGDVYFQPEFDEKGNVKGHESEMLYSFNVWHKKENLLKEFPKCNPIEYNGDDIEEPTFMD